LTCFVITNYQIDHKYILSFYYRHQKKQQAPGRQNKKKSPASPIPEAVQNVLLEAAKRNVTKANASKTKPPSTTGPIPVPLSITPIPASAKSIGRGKWGVSRAYLPIGAIVKARIHEASNSNMQEHYTARVVRPWPDPKIDPKSRKTKGDKSKSKNEMVALHFIDSRLDPHIPKTRKGKPPRTYYVEPNDVEECRLTVRTGMVSDGRVEAGSTISARYMFGGKRVRGWTGYYPVTVTEHCEDGTILVKYMHENPKHEEYLACKDLQFAALTGPDDK
jgi:hypothetical protein